MAQQQLLLRVVAITAQTHRVRFHSSASKLMVMAATTATSLGDCISASPSHEGNSCAVFAASIVLVSPHKRSGKCVNA